jgi:hypothetical protein
VNEVMAGFSAKDWNSDGPYLCPKYFSNWYYPVTDNILSLVHKPHQKPTKKRSQHTLINAQPNWRKRPHRSQVMGPRIYDLFPNVEDKLSSWFYYHILESLNNRITKKNGLGELIQKNSAVDVSIAFQVYKTICLHCGIAGKVLQQSYKTKK